MRPAGRASLPSNEELFGAQQQRPVGRPSYEDVLLGGAGGPQQPGNQPPPAPPQQPPDRGVLAYAPTKSISPQVNGEYVRPRTRSAYYNPDDEVLTIRFREGAYYAYYEVPENIWRNFRRSRSPGQFINRVLNHYRYTAVDGVQ